MHGKLIGGICAVVVGVAGCGEGAAQLSDASERRLLEHLAATRAVVAEGELVAARTTLESFERDVSRLEETGALSRDQASALLTGSRRARAVLDARIGERERAPADAPPAPGSPPPPYPNLDRAGEEADEEEREERQERAEEAREEREERREEEREEREEREGED